MRPRFHVPGFDPSADAVPMPEDEAAHLSRVLRLGPGDTVEVIDGRGGLWLAEVVQTGKRGASVRGLSAGTPAPEVGLPVTLVAGVLKADKMDAVVRDAVMLGVTAIRPVVSEHCDVPQAALMKGGRTARWQRIAVASAKQCGRAVVPVVDEVIPLARYLGGPVEAARLMCVEPSSAPPGAVGVQNVSRPAAAHVMIGPEGGWAPAEVAAAEAAGAALVMIGRRTLRADAAPLVALSALLTTWGEL